MSWRADDRWIHWEYKDGYHVWCRETYRHNTIWQVTKKDEPPTAHGGYFHRDVMYREHGIAL